MSIGKTGTVVIVDDEADVRSALRQMFEIENMAVMEFGGAEGALAAIDADFDGIVISDLRMPGMDGTALFNRLRHIDPEIPVIMMSGHGDIATAVDLVKRGAYDFLSKPFDGDALIASARRALEKRALVLENRHLSKRPIARERGMILGESPEIEKFRQTLDQLVQADINVLIIGESGTGKNLAAAALHSGSTRRRKAMVSVDCGALLGDHAESFLFGHVSGAFPGAQFPRTGQIVRADGGTLLLDNIAALPTGLQMRLLQALEDHAVWPMGANQSQTSIFRTIATGNTALHGQMESGAFDRSLYFKLSGYQLEIPPLRARQGDVVHLFRMFLAEVSADLKREPPILTSAVWRKLQDHDWPGNVRELRNYAANVAIGLGEASAASPRVLAAASNSLKTSVAEFEAELICRTLEQNGGDIMAVLAALNLPRKTLYDKMARHRIDPDNYRPKRGKISMF